MNRWQRWRQRRRWKAARRHSEPLREFVYMDDVSVYSLVASQVGLIVTELTETQATSLQSEVSAGAGATMPFAKAEVGSKVQAGENHSSQVLRKAVIQSTFKQLHEVASDSGTLGVRATGAAAPPTVRGLEGIRRLADAEQGSPWVFRPEDLSRGDLVEVDVELEAEPIYQASAVISGMLEIVQDDPAGFGLRDLGEMAQLRLVSRMLDKVLAGLVPVRGRCLHYLAVEVDGQDWLVHQELASQLAGEAIVRPVFVVGVAQQALFWKDVRRVLFSGSNYRVMARLSDGAIQQRWTPVKLVDVIGGVIPDFAATMDTMNRTVLSAMSSAVAARSTDPRAVQVNAAKCTYASLLAARCGIDVSDQDLVAAGLLDPPSVGASESVLDWREMLAPIAEYVQERSGQEIDRETTADYRVAAITASGLLERTAVPSSPATADGPSGERFLDSEIVAVYW